MDPNEALANARQALSRWHAACAGPAESNAKLDVELSEAGQELVDAFEALDQWLSKKGLFPDAWA